VCAVAQARDLPQSEVVNGASMVEARLLQRRCKESIPMSGLPGFPRMRDNTSRFTSVAGAVVAIPRPPVNQERRPVIVRRPPPAAPIPFEQKRPALDARPGKPPDRGTLDRLRSIQPSPQPQIRTGQPGTMPRQPIQRPSQPPPSKSEVRREQKNDASRSRAIQTERRREQQDTKARKSPRDKRE
jgi:hypothetical protein